MRIHVARNFLPPTLRAIEKKVSVFVCCLDQPVAGELSNKDDFGIYAYISVVKAYETNPNTDL